MEITPVSPVARHPAIVRAVSGIQNAYVKAHISRWVLRGMPKMGDGDMPAWFTEDQRRFVWGAMYTLRMILAENGRDVLPRR